MYVRLHALSLSGEEVGEVLNLTCHHGSQDPGHKASEEPRQWFIARALLPPSGHSRPSLRLGGHPWHSGKEAHSLSLPLRQAPGYVRGWSLTLRCLMLHYFQQPSGSPGETGFISGTFYRLEIQHHDNSALGASVPGRKCI